jgi:hypothetical protein
MGIAPWLTQVRLVKHVANETEVGLQPERLIDGLRKAFAIRPDSDSQTTGKRIPIKAADKRTKLLASPEYAVRIEASQKTGHPAPVWPKAG